MVEIKPRERVFFQRWRRELMIARTEAMHRVSSGDESAKAIIRDINKQLRMDIIQWKEKHGKDGTMR